MEKYDLGLAYCWEYDTEFLAQVEYTLQKAGLSTFIISDHNIEEVAERVQDKDLLFRFYLDRAWDVNEDYEQLGKALARRRTIIFNPYKKVLHAIDKATMHLEFITHGINTPYSIIIPPKAESDDIYLSLSDLAILGRPFIIKPCNTTGGGIGVVTGAESLEEIISERDVYHEDKYIIQEKVYPAMMDGRRAWFRCFWAFGRPIPAWWDDQTHMYEILTDEQLKHYKLRKLFSLTKKIADITGLDFFSTEIVYTTKEMFVAVDYLNDQCDMRMQRNHFDGVPDVIVEQIIENLRKTIIRLKAKYRLH
ncbi:MAG: hypothetical protein LWX56_13365 [Ignavibacteria bacterium]|nr:hypothetical protein [Ignavibacteria bacterium]